MNQQDRLHQANILRQAHEWRFLIEEGGATEDEQREFEQWLSGDPIHAQLYDHALTFHSSLGELNSDSLEADIRQPLLSESLRHWRDKLKGWRVSPQRGWMTGAALALLITTFLFINRDTQISEPVAENWVENTFSTKIGEISTVTLDDGSVVTLGAATELIVRFSSESRRAQLNSGSAFFDITSNPERPFLVDARDMQVAVLGTQFDVTYKYDSITVSVAEGQVQARYPYLIGSKPTSLLTRKTLLSGERISATFTRGLQQIEAIDESIVGAWRADKLFYDDAPLNDVIADINRYSLRTVMIEGDTSKFDNFRVRGSFNARDIDNMLTSLTEIYPIEIDRSDSQVIRLRSLD